MLAHSHRFHGINSLSFAYRQGRVVRGEDLALKYVLNERRKTYRVAVVVSKKVDKSAVVRNRIRRRVYEALRTSGLRITAPYDLIFTAFNNQLADIAMAQLQQRITKQLKQAGVVEQNQP